MKLVLFVLGIATSLATSSIALSQSHSSPIYQELEAYLSPSQLEVNKRIRAKLNESSAVQDLANPNVELENQLRKRLLDPSSKLERIVEELQSAAKKQKESSFNAAAGAIVLGARMQMERGNYDLAAKWSLDIYLCSTANRIRAEALRIYTRSAPRSRSQKWVDLIRSGKQDRRFQELLPELVANQTAREFELSRIAVQSPAVLTVEVVAPIVVRLDQQLDAILEADENPKRKPAAQLLRSMKPYAIVYAQLGHGDLETYSQRLVESGNRFLDENQAAKRLFSNRDLSSEILNSYTELCRQLNGVKAKPPVVVLAYGFSQGTNARTVFGDEKRAPELLLNLTALAKPGHFEMALRHELVHVLKPVLGESLLEIAMNEGVASWISLNLEHEEAESEKAERQWQQALFWSRGEWQRAIANKESLLNEFERCQNSSSREVIGSFIYLGAGVNRVPDAPSRSGYFIGMLAAQAWMASHPDAELSDLLDATPSEIWDAVQR